MPEAKKIPLIKDYRSLRRKMDLNQSEFWGRLGITQSGGSRYEDGRKVPRAVAVLAHLVYIKGQDIDAREFK
jgi:predicted transcriptional regulator